MQTMHMVLSFLFKFDSIIANIFNSTYSFVFFCSFQIWTFEAAFKAAASQQRSDCPVRAEGVSEQIVLLWQRCVWADCPVMADVSERMSIYNQICLEVFSLPQCKETEIYIKKLKFG